MRRSQGTSRIRRVGLAVATLVAGIGATLVEAPQGEAQLSGSRAARLIPHGPAPGSAAGAGPHRRGRGGTERAGERRMR
jgi:hypothetical protein